MDKASYYFDQILPQIKKVEIKDSLTQLRVMWVLTAAGEFYGNIKQYSHADDLLNYAYQVASAHHAVYFVARPAAAGRNDLASGPQLASSTPAMPWLLPA